MKFLDLFAGIGGFRIGMEQAGHECVGYVEIDKYARKSYKAIYDTEGEWTKHDITKVTDEEWRQFRGKVDVICGGFPCQSFSIAGKRRGFADETRGTLFFEIARAAKEIQPSYLFLENVKGLLNHDKGRTFRTILATLDECGYDAEWQLCNSKNFGVPQNRERVIIIGHLRGASTREVFFDAGQNGETDKPDKSVNQIGNISNSKSFGGNPQVGRVYGTNGIAPTLSTMQGGGQEPKIVIPVYSPDIIFKNQNGRRFKENGDPEFALTVRDRHGILTNSYDEIKQVASSVKKYANAVRPNAKPIVRITSKKNIRGSRQDSKKSGLSELQFTNPSNKSNTVTASHAPKTWDKDLRIRKLTPLECWRLQGFPDWAFDRAREAGLSDSQLYKQAGNSVTVPVIKAIAERMELPR